MAEFLLRISDDLYQALKQIAKQENRSVNSQLIYIIKKFISDYQQQN
jgi:hypothetical protein